MFLNHSKWLRIALEASKFKKNSPSCLGVFAYNSFSISYAPVCDIFCTKLSLTSLDSFHSVFDCIIFMIVH